MKFDLFRNKLPKMRVVWLFCYIFVYYFVHIEGAEEFVTIWASKKVYDEKDYNVVILPSDIDKRTEVGLQFRKSFGTITLGNEKVQKVRVKNDDKTGSKKEFELIMTLHRNETVSTGQRQICMTKTLQKIEAEKKQFYSFIQTDKPIYKPGDDVRFRVVVVDRDLKPYHMNNININITDSLNRPIKEFDDLEEMYNGVFTGKFQLAQNTPLGVWRIRVIIDKIDQWETMKPFTVSKFTLPPFAAYIDIQDKHLLTNALLELSFNARYSFGDFVRGNVKLTIKCISNDQTVLTKTFTDITGISTVKYKVFEELKVVTTTQLDYEATVEFTEPQSGISANKSLTFTVHAKQNPKIYPHHPEKFMPGLPFGLKVFVYDWKETLIQNSSDRVEISLNCILQNGDTRSIMVEGVIKRGVAIANAIIPEDADQLTVKIMYLKVAYEKRIEKGSVVVGVNKITIDYTPKNPNYGDRVDIYVRADSEIDQLIGIVMSRHGSIESHQVYCQYKINCKFNITIKKDMMPEAKVVVYYVKDRQNMYQGETTIVTTELGRNTLEIDLPKVTETKKKVEMMIKTKPHSKVYLLGYDKRLTYLAKGSEIKKEDVVKQLADFDGTNQVTVFHIKKTNWHACTRQEIHRIEMGRKKVVVHSGDDFTANQDENLDEDLGELESDRLPDEQTTTEAEDVRHDFREVWLFDDFDVHNGTLNKSFQVPDSITSWMISSFSINNVHGLAVGEPKEIIVKNQFFIKSMLPYSIRFKEKLRLDIMVYNYVDTKETLDVSVSMFDQEERNNFRFYDTECSSEPNTNTKPTKTVSVPHNNARKVSFYIASGSDKTKFEQLLKIRVDASATTRHGTKYYDRILNKLRVEPIGVKTYEIQTKNYNLKKQNNDIAVITEKNDRNLDEYPKFIVEIAGDYLTEDLSNVNLGYQIYPDDCLEQKTSKLKGNVEHLRYLKYKNVNPPTDQFSSYYQSVLDQKVKNWNYKGNAGFRAYFIEAIASAMDINALPRNTRIVEQELDALKKYQTRAGSFKDFGPTPPSRSPYFQTAYVLISFLKMRNFVTKNYDDVIRKGFNYLTGINSVSTSDKEAFAVAALAHALNGNMNEAHRLLDEVEKDKIKIDSNRKCYKLSQSQTACHLRHTSYVAIAYMTMNKINDAKALVTWILNQYRAITYYYYTYDVAITTEAISRFLITKEISLPTDFTVTLTNEMDFNKVVHITKANQKDTHEVAYPDYTLRPKISVKGSGYCSITNIIENTVALDQSSTKFSLQVTPLAASGTNERTVRVCATYQPREDDISLETLFNVIYDVEMPSGYSYMNIDKLDTKPEIKMASPRLARSRVQIYYNGFERGKQYCADIKTTKIFEVKDVQNAGVMVYDYNEKQNVAIEFYKFSNSCK